MNSNNKQPSPEVAELLEQPPHWLVRWGNTLVIVIISGILVATWHIKSKETIPMLMAHSFSDSIATYSARADGYFIPLVENLSLTTQGDALGWILSEPFGKDVYDLFELVHKLETDTAIVKYPWHTLSSELELGIVSDRLDALKIISKTLDINTQDELAKSQLVSKFISLKAELYEWKTFHLIISNNTGKVDFVSDYHATHTFVNKDKKIATVSGSDLENIYLAISANTAKNLTYTGKSVTMEMKLPTKTMKCSLDIADSKISNSGNIIITLPVSICPELLLNIQKKADLGALSLYLEVSQERMLFKLVKNVIPRMPSIPNEDE